MNDEAGDATGIPYDDDLAIIVNLSVWESVEALREFTHFPTPAQARAKLELLEARGPCEEVFTFGRVFGAPISSSQQ